MGFNKLHKKLVDVFPPDGWYGCWNMFFTGCCCILVHPPVYSCSDWNSLHRMLDAPRNRAYDHIYVGHLLAANRFATKNSGTPFGTNKESPMFCLKSVFFVEVSNVASMFVQNVKKKLKDSQSRFDSLSAAKFAEWGPQHSLTDSQIIPDHPRSKKVLSWSLNDMGPVICAISISISWWQKLCHSMFIPSLSQLIPGTCQPLIFTASRHPACIDSPRIRTTQRLTQMITTGTPVRRVGPLWIFWMKPDTLGVVLLIRTCWNHFRSAHWWDVAANAVAWTQHNTTETVELFKATPKLEIKRILMDFGIFRL